MHIWFFDVSLDWRKCLTKNNEAWFDLNLINKFCIRWYTLSIWIHCTKFIISCIEIEDGLGLTVRLIENMNWSVWIFTVIKCLIANKPITSRYLRLNTAYGNEEIYLLEQLSFPKLLFIYLIIHRHFRPVSFYVVNEAYSDIPKH